MTKHYQLTEKRTEVLKDMSLSFAAVGLALWACNIDKPFTVGDALASNNTTRKRLVKAMRELQGAGYLGRAE